MSVIFNLIVVLLVGLIGYWWANQGVFSALLHLVCVVVAGAIALAFWEPLTVNVLLRGTAFDDYAWGVSLIGLFVVSLFALRVAVDKLVPSNINLPTWANMVFGFPLGAAAGVLTIGLTFIGLGFIQSHQEIMGYRGYGRSANAARIEALSPVMWVPVHRIADEFFAMLSVGALYPTFDNTPALHYNPELYKQASLLRDSYDSGRGKLSLPPEAVRIQRVMFDQRSNRYLVTVRFTAGARDWGEQLTLSRSQVRLICRSPGQRSRPPIVHPDFWRQETPHSHNERLRFAFDDPTHYITSLPGQQEATVDIEFPVPAGHTPQFIQIRGTRLRLPPATPGDLGSPGAGPAMPAVQLTPGGLIPRIDEQVKLDSGIHPVHASTNQALGTLRHVDNYFTEGEHTFHTGRDMVMGRLRIRGLHQPLGTRVVQVDVSRNSPASIFGPARDHHGASARIALVDELGNRYSPIGYIHQHRQGVTIKLDPRRLLATADNLPFLPTAGEDRLRVIFHVTEGRTITALHYGDTPIGQCNVLVIEGR
jgi:hypothetical protein